MITSRQNEHIKSIRRLRLCKDEFAFLEGPHLLEEVLGAGLELVEILATAEFLARPEGKAIAARLETPALEVSNSVLASVTDAVSPQGIVAVAKLRREGVQSLPQVPDGIYLLLDRIQDPGNLGAVVRSAEATSVAGIALTPGCAHPNNPKALRASGGSLLRVPVARGARLAEVLAHLAEIGPRLVALEVAGGEDLYRAELEGALLLALGAEGPGLDSELRARADSTITIPVAPPVDSLNVSVAAGVVLHELTRRRRLREPTP